MKFTLTWLKDHLDTDAALDEIAKTLNQIGLEVESISDPAADMKGFVVGEVVECEQHPDADRLKLCVVDTGAEKLQVVCGAPNARLGLKGVFAPSGSYIPGLDITLKKAKIRGQESNGMLCSEKELCLSDEHKGIIDLPADTKTGMSAATVLGLDDPVIEIGLTPNRPDCTGVRGIARDLAAAGLGTLKPLNTKAVKAKFDSLTDVKIDKAAARACPLFLGRSIRGVKNGPSPKWLQDRLKAIGLRPISALVDITNYMTMDLARPLHVFDAAQLKGDIQIRLSKQGENLNALDDKAYTLEDGMTVVCDDSGVLGLGGIIGGVPSAVTDETVDVYLECAWFDPVATALSGQKLQVNSDARYRFERGIDPVFTQDGIEIGTQMILDICGGEAGSVVMAGAVPDTKRTIAFDPNYVEQLGGLAVAEKTQIEILEKLGFAVQKTKSGLDVVPPPWRCDVEGRADLVEEVLRMHGYDQIPTVLLRTDDQKRVPAINAVQKRDMQLRRMLAARGLREAVTWSFMAPKHADLFGVNDHQAKAALTLINPISVELSVMRPSILPNLIQAVGQNAARGLNDAALFEIGPCYKTAKYDGQKNVACGVRSGVAVARHWAVQSRDTDAYDAKADALAVLRDCGLSADALQITDDAPDWYHPGRSGHLRLGPQILASFGEIHPAVLSDLDVSGPVAGFEVFLDAVPPQKNRGPARKPLHLSPLQPLSRDLAFVVDEAVEAGKLVQIARSVDKTLITNVSVFDVYAGKGIDEGQKSVALAVTLQPQDKTLTDAEIEALMEKIVKTVSEKTGASLRG